MEAIQFLIENVNRDTLYSRDNDGRAPLHGRRL
jgi:hypothetical protein